MRSEDQGRDGKYHVAGHTYHSRPFESILSEYDRYELEHTGYRICYQVDEVIIQDKPRTLTDTYRYRCERKICGRDHPVDGPAVETVMQVDQLIKDYGDIGLKSYYPDNVVAQIYRQYQVGPGYRRTHHYYGYPGDRMPQLVTDEIIHCRENDLEYYENKSRYPDYREAADSWPAQSWERGRFGFTGQLALTQRTAGLAAVYGYPAFWTVLHVLYLRSYMIHICDPYLKTAAHHVNGTS